jgi:hypothetical protein
MSYRRSEATLVSSTRFDSQTRNRGGGGRLRCAVKRTGIWRSPGWSCRRGTRPAGQLHRHLEGQGSAGGRAAPWRPWRSSARATAGVLACSAVRIRSCGRPAVRRTQNARFVKLRGPALPALERTTSWEWRAGDREPLPGPIGGGPFGWTGIPRRPGVVCSPRRGARRQAWPGRTRPRRCTLPQGHENSTSKNALL